MLAFSHGVSIVPYKLRYRKLTPLPEKDKGRSLFGEDPAGWLLMASGAASLHDGGCPLSGHQLFPRLGSGPAWDSINSLRRRPPRFVSRTPGIPRACPSRYTGCRPFSPVPSPRGWTAGRTKGSRSKFLRGDARQEPANLNVSQDGAGCRGLRQIPKAAAAEVE